MSEAISKRETVFVTHAAPEDNDFALWLSSKLTIAGYRVWVDKRRLRGGDDFWDEIDRMLRYEAVKQIVVFTKNASKSGVKKELAIGSIMAGRLKDPKFMIPIRADDVSFSDAPPEFVRGTIIDAHPGWHDCLEELFAALDAANVPKRPTPDDANLRTLIEAREDGRRFVVRRPETCLTNWFPVVTPPEHVRYYRFDGPQTQINMWLSDQPFPYVSLNRLVGTFADPSGFAAAGPFTLTASTAYDVSFRDFVSGRNTGPLLEQSDAGNHVVNLLRQHFAKIAEGHGLKSVEFGNKEVGWFFPDGLLPRKVAFVDINGKIKRRTLSGKFKLLRWHTCLIVRPRLRPTLVYRVHINVVLSKDGKTPLAGDTTHRRRRRLTRSWWNDVWRDRLLAAMSFLADGKETISALAGNELIEIGRLPLLIDVPVSYDATDPPPKYEEDEEGNINPLAALDDREDDLENEKWDNGE
jgi:TIR domain-containing protein